MAIFWNRTESESPGCGTLNDFCFCYDFDHFDYEETKKNRHQKVVVCVTTEFRFQIISVSGCFYFKTNMKNGYRYVWYFFFLLQDMSLLIG